MINKAIQLLTLILIIAVTSVAICFTNVEGSQALTTVFRLTILIFTTTGAYTAIFNK